MKRTWMLLLLCAGLQAESGFKAYAAEDAETMTVSAALPDAKAAAKTLSRVLNELAVYRYAPKENSGEFKKLTSRLKKNLRLREKQADACPDYPWLAEVLHVCVVSDSPYLAQTRLLRAALAMGGDVNALDEDGHAAWYYALQLSTQRVLRPLLEAGVTLDIHGRGEEDMTPLMYAALEGDKAMVEELLADGAHVNALTEQGQSVLCYALAGGHEELALQLMAAGAHADSGFEDDEGVTLLHQAAAGGCLTVLNRMLEQKPDVNAAAKNGRTPLMSAAYHGHVDVVKRLLKAGADVMSRTPDGDTALKLAIESGDEELVLALWNAYPKTVSLKKLQPELDMVLAIESAEVMRCMLPKLRVQAGWKAVLDEYFAQAMTGLESELPRVLLEAGASFDVEQMGWNYLGMALQSGDEKMLHLLQEAGAEFDAVTPDDMGDTHLMLAAEGCFPEVVAQLLQADDVDLQARNDEGAGVMLHALRGGNAEVVRMVRAAGVPLDPTEKTQDGETQLMAAAENGLVSVVRELIAAGAKVNARTTEGDTALALAMREGHAETVKVLRAAGARMPQGKPGDRTALMDAAMGGLSSVVKDLLKKGADVDAVLHTPHSLDYFMRGRTALMMAARAGHVEVVRLLVEAGANPYLEDWRGDNALEHAEQNHCEAVVEYLKTLNGKTQ